MRCPTLVLFAVVCLMACAATVSHPHAAKSTASNAVPQPAIPAVLSAFDSYEVVAMPVGHGKKDIDQLEAQQPILEGPPPPPDVKAIEQSCRAQQEKSAPR